MLLYPVSNEVAGSVATTACSLEELRSNIPQSIRDVAERVSARGLELRYSFNSVFAGYEKLGELGSGTYAKVYKVRHAKSNKVFAAKQLRPDKYAENTQARIIKMFGNELLYLQKVQCFGVVKLHEVVVSFDGILLVQEYVDGGTIWRDNVCPVVATKWSHLVMLAQAVQFMHEHGVTHRDLKPTNILRTSDGYLKIADFGWSESIKNLAHFHSEWPGTLEINPPEVLKLKGPMTEKIDTFAVGMNFLLFVSNRFLCRQKDLSVQNAATMILANMQSLQSSAKLPPKFTYETWEIFLGLTHPDPHKRWSLNCIWHHPWVVRNFLYTLDSGNFDNKRFYKLLWYAPVRSLLMSFRVPASVSAAYERKLAERAEAEKPGAYQYFVKLGRVLEWRD